MELQFLRQEALDALNKNIGTNIACYASDKDAWIDDFFAGAGIKNPLFDADIDMGEIELLLGDDASLDTENAIRVHQCLKGKINAVQATDRRLWGALAHSTFYSYMCSRWPVENKLNEKGTNGTVTDRYFFARGFFRNGISRLYWIPELTFDEAFDDPYEYTKYLIGKQDLINQVDGRSLCRNRKTLMASLRILKKAEPLSEKLRRQYFENLCKRGGVTVLDALPEDSLDMICAETLDKTLETKQIENGCKVTVETIGKDARCQFEVRSGKFCQGKTVFRSKPESLYRLTVGKEVEIGKIRYRIVKIDEKSVLK